MPTQNIEFKISSHSPFGKSCVGVARKNGGILVTNTNLPDRPTVEFTVEEWKAFLLGVKDGEFDFDR